jgi:serine/threonine-protein kinase HipA
MGNTDAHLKNWTLTYPDGHQARLSPAYDFVCVTCYGDFRNAGLAFHLGGEKNFGAIVPRHFQLLAASADLDDGHVLGVVDAAVHDLLDCWPRVRRESPAPEQILRHVDERLRTLPLFSGRGGMGSGRGHGRMGVGAGRAPAPASPSDAADDDDTGLS